MDSVDRLRDFKTLALIPARAGSKGLPDKNILKIGDSSLLELAIKAAQGAKYVDDVLLSTDSEIYASLGSTVGAWIPSLRPSHLASDDANIMDTVRYVMSELALEYDKRYDAVLIVEPSSPCRTSDDLDKVIERLMLNDQISAVATVSRLSAHYHPRKILSVNNDFIDHYLNADAEVTNRQELDTLYIRNGIGYALRVSALENRTNAIGGMTAPLVIDRPIVNIDDQNDLTYYKFLLASSA